MSRFIFTQYGLEMAKTLKIDKEEEKPCPNYKIQPKNYQMNQLVQQCNKFRIKTLKQNFTSASATKLPQPQPQLQMTETSSSSNYLLLKQLQDQSRIKTNSDQISLGKHHINSIRLRTGEWFQWKNMPFAVHMIDTYQKQISTPIQTSEETRMKNEKKLQKYADEKEEIKKVNSTKELKLTQMNEKRSINYNKDQDEFWKKFQQETKNLFHYEENFHKDQKRWRQRLDKCVSSKYKFIKKKQSSHLLDKSKQQQQSEKNVLSKQTQNTHKSNSTSSSIIAEF